jgi:hypothetical protein
MDPVLVGLRDVNEHAGQKLEGVDDTVVVEVMSGLGLVEDELGVWMIAKPGEVHRRAHQIAGESPAFAEASARQGWSPSVSLG